MSLYNIDNFVRTPVEGDVNIKIYDKLNNLKYIVSPDIAFFHRSANILLIKIKNSNDIILDFESDAECNDALVKLNGIKQTILSKFPGSGGKTSVFSKNNLNMTANITTTDGDLACDVGILDTPISSSPVMVFINGVEVRVGGKIYPYSCYFSVDGITVRRIGDERKGDKLYWNGSVSEYELDETDFIDFVYLIN